MLDEEAEEEKTEQNSGDVKVTNITDKKNSILESKKVSLPLHRKKLSQSQLKKLDSIFSVDEQQTTIHKSFVSEDYISGFGGNTAHELGNSPDHRNTPFKLNLTENQGFPDTPKLMQSNEQSPSKGHKAHDD